MTMTFECAFLVIMGDLIVLAFWVGAGLPT